MATQKYVVTGDQYRQIDRRILEIKRQLNQDGGSPLDPEYVSRSLQLIVEGGKLVPETAQEIWDTITVPDLSAAELMIRAQRRSIFLSLRPDIAAWNFMQQDERGKTYEVMTWAPCRGVSTDEVRAYFKRRGFGGNTAAFIAWMMAKQPLGFHASIPDEDMRLFRDTYGELLVPRFRQGDTSKVLEPVF
jgi:hypothetical protein